MTKTTQRPRELAHRVALVTGAATGIGAGIAGALASAGALVFLVDVDPVNGEARAKSLSDDGHAAHFLEADVTSEADVRRAMQHVEAQAGLLDVLVNNAGGAPRIPFAEITAKTWRDILDLNLGSVYTCTHAALPLLRAGRSSCVVNVTSLHADTTLSGMSAYAAAKGGVASLTRALAIELAPDIRVNAVAPGLIETTGWLESVDDPEAARTHRLAYHPLERLGTPQDVAAAVAYLASDAAAFVTGVVLPVAGGLGLRLYAKDST